MSKIQVSARLTIPFGRLDEFKQHVSECIKQVKEKDHGTLQYDWFLSSDRTECEIREAYESSEDALLHQLNLREELRQLFDKFGTLHSLVIYGEPSPALLESAKLSGTDVTVFSYLQGL